MPGLFKIVWWLDGMKLDHDMAAGYALTGMA